MYHTSYFKEKDLEIILNFIETHPFAFLTGSFVNGTQAPVLLEKRNGDLLLQTHLKRNTDHHRAFKENPYALVVFTGLNAYVSATYMVFRFKNGLNLELYECSCFWKNSGNGY